MKINIKKEVFNDIYLKYIDCYTRFFILYGGSASGKSVFIAQRIILNILKGGRNYLAVRKVGSTVKNSVYALLKKVINEWGLTHLFNINKTDMSITCIKNGYKIICMGLDDPEKIKSITVEHGIITDIWLEEATEFNEVDLSQLNLRLRGKSSLSKQVVMTFNPISNLHWIKKRFFDRIDDDVTVLKTTYKDNKFLEDEDIREIEKLKDIDYVYYQVYALGEWGVLGHLVFNNWKVKKLDEEIKIYNNFRHGLDWGVNDPFAVCKNAINENKKEIYIFDEIYQKGIENNKEIIDMVKPFVEKRLVVCDNTEIKSINDLNNAGIRAIPAVKGKDSVIHGIKWLRLYTIYIDPRCINTINEFQMYKYRQDKDGNVMEEPVDKNNHIIDTLRYAFEDLMGKPKPIKLRAGSIF